MTTEPPDDEAAQEAPKVRLDLTPDELEYVRSALMLLQSTLGHEEADELREVMELIRKIESAQRG
jgi:hypothetical protein